MCPNNDGSNESEFTREVSRIEFTKDHVMFYHGNDHLIRRIPRSEFRGLDNSKLPVDIKYIQLDDNDPIMFGIVFNHEVTLAMRNGIACVIRIDV
jgi:hypothetical protein